MANTYTPPGVSVQELSSPTVNPFLASPANVCLVGLTRGYQTKTVNVKVGPNDTTTLTASISIGDTVIPAANVTNFDSQGEIVIDTENISYANKCDTTTTTTLSAAINNSATVIGVVDASVFPDAGTVLIDSEQITYTSKTAVSLLGCSRGAQSTSAASHALNTTVTCQTIGFFNLTRGDHGTTAAAHLNAATINSAGTRIAAPTNSIFQKVDPTQTFESAVDAVDPSKGSGTSQSGYVEGVDYTTTVTSDYKSILISGIGGGLDTTGAYVRVTYRYLGEKYFAATRCDTSSLVEDLYGPAYGPDGKTISCVVTYAAQIAFENGSPFVIIQPLFKNLGEVRAQPSASEAAQVAQWQNTFLALRDFEEVNIVVPVIGQSYSGVGDNTQQSIFKAAQDHTAFMKTQGQYIITIGGEDSTTSSSNAQPDTLQAHAEELSQRYGGDQAENFVLVSPSSFSRVRPGDGQFNVIGGQYVASAVAGLLASRPVNSPLTRKIVGGFDKVNMVRLRTEKDADAGSGLMVVEQRGRVVQIRHSITVDTTNSPRRELSVVRAKHHMIESIRETLNSQIIGQVPANNNAPLTVKNAVSSVLEQLALSREIVSYTGVEARQLSLDPTTVECRFSYLPAFPLNYVNIVFSIDLTSGVTEVGNTTTTPT